MPNIAVLAVRFPNTNVSPIVLTQSMVATNDAFGALSNLLNGSGIQPDLKFTTSSSNP